MTGCPDRDCQIERIKAHDLILRCLGKKVSTKALISITVLIVLAVGGTWVNMLVAQGRTEEKIESFDDKYVDKETMSGYREDIIKLQTKQDHAIGDIEEVRKSQISMEKDIKAILRNIDRTYDGN